MVLTYTTDETNEEFWEHEWYEHGTCVSTLDPSCYTDYETGMEAVDFFQITVNLFKSLVRPYLQNEHLRIRQHD